MGAQLVIRVQVDRLPNVESDDTLTVQVGLRLSGAIRPEQDKPLPDHDNRVDDLLPWKWRTANGTHDFDPHSPTSWRVYHQKAPREAITLLSDGVTAAITNIDDMPEGFLDRLNADADELAAQPATLALPADKSPDGGPDTVTGRTVFGLVESLTSLPYPIPVATNTFTALSIDAEKVSDLGEDSRFFAVPIMAPATGGTSDYSGTFNWSVLDSERVDQKVPAASGNWSEIFFEIQGSKSSRFLSLDPNDPERVMDLMDLSIAQSRAKQEVETGEDWAAHLPRRLAEAVDPAVRVNAAIESALAGFAIDDDTRAKLRTDLLPDGENEPAFLLLKYLDRAASTVVSPRARCTADMYHEAIVLLTRLAFEENEESAKREARDLLLTHLTTETADAKLVRLSDLGARFISASRVARAVGFPPEDAALAIRPGEKSADALDEEKGFKAFALRHWFAAGAPGTNADLTGNNFSPIPGADPMPSAVLDQALFDTTGLGFFIALPETGDAYGRITLYDPTRSAILHQIEFRRTGGSYQLKIDDQDVAGTFAPVLNLELFRAEPGAPVSIRGAVIDEPVAGSPVRHPFTDRFIASFETSGDDTTVAPRRPAGRLITSMESIVTASGLRKDVSLAHAAPYLPELIALRRNWVDVNTPDPAPGTDPNTGEPVPFRNRLAASAKTLLHAILDDCFKLDSGDEWLKDILDAIRNEAVGAVEALVLSALPERGPSTALATVSESALPLTFRIDQLAGFDGNEDLWQRLSGVGLLLSRAFSDDGNDPANDKFDPWYSLNAAAIAARPDAAGEEDEEEPDYKYTNFAPWMPGETGAVRQSLVRYQNNWLATYMIDDPTLDPAEALEKPAIPRRPDVIASPNLATGEKTARLPALSYGYHYRLFPYLIGQGAVLPLSLRADPKRYNPVKPKAGRANVLNTFPADTVEDDVEAVPYLRSRAVGTPQILSADDGAILPAIPEGVDPLAMELPIRPPQVTLMAGVPSFFFRDRSGKTGILALGTPRAEPVDDKPTAALVPLSRTGISLSFRGIDKQDEKITVKFYGTTGPKNASRPFAEIEVTLKADQRTPNLRLDLLRDVSGTKDQPEFAVSLQAFKAPDSVDGDSLVYAEDIPKYVACEAEEVTVRPLEDLKKPWDQVFVSVAANGVTLEPPVVTTVEQDMLGAAARTDADLPAATGKPLLPLEIAHQARQVALVHDFGGETAANFRLRRPTVDFPTFERWVNTAFLEDPGKTDYRSIVNRAYSLSEYEPQAEGNGKEREKIEKDYDDPATTMLLLELVEVFPRFRLITRKATQPLSGTDLFQGFRQPRYDDDGLVVGVDQFEKSKYTTLCSIRSVGEATPLPDDATETLTISQSGIAVETLPGRVYELRVSGVVPDAQPGNYDDGERRPPVACSFKRFPTRRSGRAKLYLRPASGHYNRGRDAPHARRVWRKLGRRNRGNPPETPAGCARRSRLHGVARATSGPRRVSDLGKRSCKLTVCV